jgi:hypothetical protein
MDVLVLSNIGYPAILKLEMGDICFHSYGDQTAYRRKLAMQKWIQSLQIACLALMLGLAHWSYGPSNSAKAQASIPQVVVANCASDIRQFCSNITIGGGRVVACLYAHNDKITGQCTIAMIEGSAALNATMGALRHLAKTTSCRSDLRQYCKGIPAGGGRLYRCLRKNFATLTDGCRSAMPKAKALLVQAGLL